MRKILCLLMTFAALAAASAQPYSYTELSLDEGFPSSVNSIFIEESGFAWLGAGDALYLLYGNNSFSRHDRSQGYLPGNNVLQVLTDSHGMAWILTDKGFIGYNSRLNIEHPSFIKGMDGSQVAYCVRPQGDNIYFGGNGCIWKFDHRSGKFSTLCEFETQFKVTDLILSFREGRTVLAAFSKGMTENYLVDIIDGSILAGEELASGFCAGFSDSRGYTWISLFDAGVYRMSPSMDIVQRYDSTTIPIDDNNVLCFAERHGKIWMGTDGGGIKILDPWDATIQRLDLSEHRMTPDPATTVSTMFCDHNGHVWCGRPNGGVLIVSETHIEMFRTEDFDPQIDTKGISYFYQDGPTDDIWVGTYGSGLMKYDQTTGKFTGFPSTEGLHIYSMAKVDDDTIALSCPNKGFFYFYKKTGQIERFEPLSEYKYYYATVNDGVFVDNDAHGNVLMFSHDVKRWNKLTGELETFTPDHDRDLGYLHPIRGSMCQYILDFTHIYKWNESLPDKLEVVGELTDGSRFFCSSMNRDGTIWFGAGGRIGQFNTETREIIFDKHVFEPAPSLIFSADNGKLWLGTRNALYVINPESNSIITLGESDGVADNEYILQAKMQAANGDIYLGGSKGMLRIHTDFSLPSSPDPDIVVSGVTVDGEEVFDFGGITVPVNHSTLAIRFLVRGTDILTTHMHRIQVKGPGGWVMDEESNKPFISFRGLNPGHYILSVSTTTQDGRWTEPKEIFTFNVAHHWYGTWWAIILFLMCSGMLCFNIYRTLSTKRTAERAKVADEERYNFLINVSHELRTPLTLILGPLRRIMADPSLKDNHRESIKKVCRQADRMATLLNTVLTTDKIGNGATKVNPRSININEWLENCSEEFNDEAMGREMSITLKTDPGAGSVMMDPDLCRIVFSNIMSNALRHNQPGHHITVWSSADIHPGYVRIGIRDHGSGIGVVDVSKLFERYYRATEEHTGFGIGLSYAKTIVDAHGGKIGAFNNDKDAGATFWFELPAAAIPGESIGEAPRYVSKLTRTILAKDLKDKIILFVDDSKYLRDYVESELKDLCKEFLMAYNGAEALRVLAAHEVDVVVTDVMMPEIDGVELCRIIKTSPNYRHIPVIMLSARADEESKARGYAVKADQYMSKPFDIKDLIAILDNKTRRQI